MFVSVFSKNNVETITVIFLLRNNRMQNFKYSPSLLITQISTKMLGECMTIISYSVTLVRKLPWYITGINTYAMSEVHFYFQFIALAINAIVMGMALVTKCIASNA